MNAQSTYVLHTDPGQLGAWAGRLAGLHGAGAAGGRLARLKAQVTP